MKKVNKVSSKTNKTTKIQRSRKEAAIFRDKVIWLYLTTNLGQSQIAKKLKVTQGYISQIINKFESDESIEVEKVDHISEYLANRPVEITQDFKIVEVESKKKFFGITYSTSKTLKFIEVITFVDWVDSYTLEEDIPMTLNRLRGLEIDLHSKPHTTKLVNVVLEYYTRKVLYPEFKY